MVMEYLEGRDLAQELDEYAQLPISDAVDYVLQASEAVAEAHALGIVHRDLKPANLFLTRRSDGSALVKVLDFGISKALLNEEGQPAVSLTGTQALIGSPNYMSPEQVRTPKTVDTRSDIWALGVILFELVTGQQPFIAETSMSVLAAVVSDTPQDPGALRSDLPDELVQIIYRCLEKQPARRFQSIAELAEALQPFAPASSAHCVARISGILRARPSTPAPSASSTLVSNTPDVVDRRQPKDRRTPEEIAEDETLPATSDPAPGRSNGTNDTAVEWGTSSEPRMHRSRTLVYAAVGFAAVAAIAALGLATRGTTAPSAGAEAGPAHTLSTPAAPVAPRAPVSAPTAEASATQSREADAAAAGGRASAASQKNTSAKPKSGRPVTRAPEPTKQPEAGGATSPLPKVADPLDGRR
jgi:serine/threonine-protein kinase